MPAALNAPKAVRPNAAGPSSSGSQQPTLGATVKNALQKDDAVDAALSRLDSLSGDLRSAATQAEAALGARARTLEAAFKAVRKREEEVRLLQQTLNGAAAESEAILEEEDDDSLGISAAAVVGADLGVVASTSTAAALGPLDAAAAVDELLQRASNRHCFDCEAALGAETVWCSLSHGVMLCRDCGRAHASFATARLCACG